MKSYNYKWSEDIYLIHIETNNKVNKDQKLEIHRIGIAGKIAVENRKIAYGTERFIVMRLNSEELSIELLYDDESIISVFEIEDRAYFPAIPIFVS